VLSAFYWGSAAEIATAVQMLLNHKNLSVQHSEVVSQALDHFRRRPALGFSHCLLLDIARKAGHLPLGTFDRDLSRLPDAQRL